MGEVIDFIEYLHAKREGMSVKQYRAAKANLDKMLSEMSLDDFGDSVGDYMEHEGNNENWPEGYPYVLEEDIESGYHDDCNHSEWHIVEEGYQATCNHCDLNAWSAPW